MLQVSQTFFSGQAFGRSKPLEETPYRNMQFACTFNLISLNPRRISVDLGAESYKRLCGIQIARLSSLKT